MRLLVIRHAIAMDRDEFHRINADDGLRPLTAEGIKKMRKIAARMPDFIERIDVLVSSPLTRAVQTAEIVAATYGEDNFLKIPELAPGRPAADLLKWLKRTAEKHSVPIAKGKRRKPSDFTVAVVGHEPHLSTSISWMLTGAERPILELKKGGLCLLEFPNGLEAGRAEMKWLLKPSLLLAKKKV